jgi:hypothetical protein
MRERAEHRALSRVHRGGRIWLVHFLRNLQKGVLIHFDTAAHLAASAA